jgi:UDP-glucose 4-epimerase
MNILVTGGAGYIGSHAAHYLAASGHEVWVYDNLSQGHAPACDAGRLIVADTHDQGALRKAFRAHGIEAVLHFAGSALVGESIHDPAKYYDNNVVASLSLLEAMRLERIKTLVFSSTCSVYGNANAGPISERAPVAPINPYGASKLVVERAIDDYATAYGIAGVVLRYFNAAGAALDGSLGEDHSPETHLIPLTLQCALGQRTSICIHGDDYPTVDGTCVRDYIHVEDLATAHAAALHHAIEGQCVRLNLGTGHGYSVRQVVDACQGAVGRPLPVEIGPRRQGDPDQLVADPTLAIRTLDWRPTRSDLKTIVASAWNWHRQHPSGYR